MSVADRKAARKRMIKRYGNAGKARSIADAMAAERQKAAKSVVAKKK